jgi:hypothetical protein
MGAGGTMRISDRCCRGLELRSDGFMAAERVSELLDLSDEVFQRPRWHSLLGSLESVAPADWF